MFLPGSDACGGVRCVLTEECSVHQLIMAVVAVCKRRKRSKTSGSGAGSGSAGTGVALSLSERQEAAVGAQLLASDPSGQVDEDIPPLDPGSFVNYFGLSYFVLLLSSEAARGLHAIGGGWAGSQARG